MAGEVVAALPGAVVPLGETIHGFRHRREPEGGPKCPEEMVQARQDRAPERAVDWARARPDRLNNPARRRISQPHPPNPEAEAAGKGWAAAEAVDAVAVAAEEAEPAPSVTSAPRRL